MIGVGVLSLSIGPYSRRLHGLVSRSRFLRQCQAGFHFSHFRTSGFICFCLQGIIGLKVRAGDFVVRATSADVPSTGYWLPGVVWGWALNSLTCWAASW